MKENFEIICFVLCFIKSQFLKILNCHLGDKFFLLLVLKETWKGLVSTQNRIYVSFIYYCLRILIVFVVVKHSLLFCLFNRCRMIHLVLGRLWPVSISILVLDLLCRIVYWAHFGSYSVFFLGLFFLLGVSFFWFYDVIREAWCGYRRTIVIKGLRFGVVFFIISEIFLFFCFFWAYFHKCFSPSFVLCNWPPIGFSKIILDPFRVPFFKTIILLSSGVSITLCHHCLLAKDYFGIFIGFRFTIFLGLLFLWVQFEEYCQRYFSANFTIYGTLFFMLTGFHGLHVTFGISFIIVCYIRFILDDDFSSRTMVSFEAAAWYWHFVDVVWLFLFIFLYVYGS